MTVKARTVVAFMEREAQHRRVYWQGQAQSMIAKFREDDEKQRGGLHPGKGLDVGSAMDHPHVQSHKGRTFVVTSVAQQV